MKPYIIALNMLIAVSVFLTTIESKWCIVLITTLYIALSAYLFSKNKEQCYRALRVTNYKIERFLHKLNI